MVNKHPKEKRRKRRESSPERVGERIFALLQKMGGDRERAKTANLKRDWRVVVGEEIAEMAIFAGCKDVTLYVEAEDALVMQELRMREPEILEMVGMYLKTDKYVKMRINLAGKK